MKTTQTTAVWITTNISAGRRAPRIATKAGNVELPAMIDSDLLKAIKRRAKREKLTVHFLLDELLHFGLKHCPEFSADYRELKVVS